MQRKSGDAVVPLRLDLTALIQHAQLSLKSDDDDEVDAMTLQTRADVLIGPGGGVSVQCTLCCRHSVISTQTNTHTRVHIDMCTHTHLHAYAYVRTTYACIYNKY